MGLMVRLPNAFTINRLGTPDGSISFPFSISNYEDPTGVYRMSLHPQSVFDLCNIFEDFKKIVVFEVSSDVKLSEVVATRKIGFQAIDSGTIVISGNDLCGLLADLNHYDFHAFDVRDSSSEDEIIECVLVYYEHKWGNNPLLPQLAPSTFFLDSHDDCYIYIESYDLSILREIFGRALQIYSGTVLFEVTNFDGDIAELPKALIEALWPVNSSLTILRDQTKVDEKRLRIGISQIEFNFEENREYPISTLLQYDASDGVWRIL